MAHVLVVEDDPAIRQMLTVALEIEGHVTTTLSDGTNVVSTLQRATERMVVLMDLMMPRMTGWEVCERLAMEPELAQRHAVVVMSAGITPGDKFPDVVRAALLKPFNLTTALSLVEALSGSPEAAMASHQVGAIATSL